MQRAGHRVRHRVWHPGWAGIVRVGLVPALALGAWLAACARAPKATEGEAPAPRSSAGRGIVRPGITVLLEDSVHLVRGKRVGLLTNQTGVDARGTSDIDLLTTDPRATAAGVRLVTLFSPEHGIRGTEDREMLDSGVDQKTGLPIHSLYRQVTI